MRKIDIRPYFLTGRINNQMCNIKSNLFRFFTPINQHFNILITKINNTLPSVFPCKGTLLNDEHERELGIPDSVFRNYLVHVAGFPYTFPIVFGSDYNIDLDKERTNDIIVKKYLMADNSINGFIKIAGEYDMSIRFMIQPMGAVTGAFTFPYTFPISFGVDATGECATGVSTNCETLIEVWGGSNLQLIKLEAIYNLIKPLGMHLKVRRGGGVRPYTPTKFC